MPHPSEVRLRDPLSEVTRKERRTLLGASAIGVLILRTGLVPSKIAALGIEFNQADQKALLGALGAIVVYFLVAFMIYASSDLVAWRVAIYYALADRQAEIEKEKRQREREEKIDTGQREREGFEVQRREGRAWTVLARPTSVVRAVFEFGVPVLIGLYAAAKLLKAGTL